MNKITQKRLILIITTILTIIVLINSTMVYLNNQKKISEQSNFEIQERFAGNDTTEIIKNIENYKTDNSKFLTMIFISSAIGIVLVYLLFRDFKNKNNQEIKTNLETGNKQKNLVTSIICIISLVLFVAFLITLGNHNNNAAIKSVNNNINQEINRHK